MTCRQDASARTRIDAILKQAVDAKEVPGVVALAATDKGVLYEGAFGPRALEAGASPMTTDTVFRIASMTKAIASVAAMQLVEQGTLKLDKWMYGVNTDWAGRTVETVNGQALEDYFRERIFGPLGMKDSGYVTTAEQRSRQARLHTRQADGSLALQPLEPVPAKGEFWSAGGPLYSTPRDYFTFTQMLLRGGSVNGQRILKPETVALMNQNHTGNIPCGVMKAELKNLSSAACTPRSARSRTDGARAGGEP